MRTLIDMARADLDESDANAVLEVLCSGRLALGPKAPEFELAVAEYVGVKHAISVSSGTAALHLIVRALGLGPGDEVLVPSFTFAASVNALLYEGAVPVFVDITPDTFNIDPHDARTRITPRTRAILAVDVFGHPAPWDELQSLADEYGLLLIDDCCEALGSRFQGQPLGSFGNAGAFAFYPNKQITAGEGGMIVTNDDRIARETRSMANQGRAEMGSWLEHAQLGFNYRMDEMSAALGCSQIARLDTFIARRAHVADMYTTRLTTLPFLRPPFERPGIRMSYFVYVVLLEPGLDRDLLMKALESEGIPSRGYFSPIHLQPYIQAHLDRPPGCLPVTEDIARRTIALPFHNALTPEEVHVVADALEGAVALA